MNIAFIDGQNLHLGTWGTDKQKRWRIDHKRFRNYLKDKYNVGEAYYYFGHLKKKQKPLYNNLQKAGFIIRFKQQALYTKTEKKGNVDVDIVFDIMKSVCEGESFDKLVLVSGDGDYKKMVDYLISKEKFEKILFPNKKFASSLYKPLHNEYALVLSWVREKIELK